jgi:mono/diheme cytochrome c family protein
VKRALLVVALASLGCGPDLSPTQARQEAEKIWAERCTNCHGPRGLGDGPGALILRVKPRALADSGWQASVTDEHIATVIVDGGQSVGLSPDMAANPDLKTQPEVLDALVQYVRSLAP